MSCKRLAAITVRILPVFVLAAWMTFVAGVEPLAAQEGEVLLEDDFQTLDPSLGVEDETLYLKDGVLNVEEAKGYYWRSFYESMIVDDVDVSVRVRLPDFGAETDASIGLGFWAAGLNDFYVLMISDSGSYSVWRATSDGWYLPIPWRDTDAIKREPGDWNDLRVVTSGRRATIYINGKQLASFRGQPPADGSLVGFYIEAKQQDVLGEFSKVIIKQGPASTEEAGDPNVLFSDDFASLDPVWGPPKGWFNAKDGHLEVTFDADETHRFLYEAEQFGDVDASVKLRVDGEPLRNAGGGVLFWAKNLQDMYLAQLFADGAFAVFRRTAEKGWDPVYPPKPSPEAAKFASGDWNEIRVKAVGKRATIFLNGARIVSLPGHPPEGSSLVGLSGQSDEKPCKTQFDDFVIRKP